MTGPGHRLRAVASRICDAETMERLVDPVIADLQVEHDEAARNGRAWKRRWIRFAGWFVCLKALAAYEGDRMIHEWQEGRPSASSLWVAFAVTLAVTLLLEAPFLRGPNGQDRPRLIWVVYLLPQALTISLPIGLALGVFRTLRYRSISRRLTTAVVVAAMTCSAAAFVNAAWIAPAANQAFRVSLAGAGVLRGASELPLGELGRMVKPGANARAHLAGPYGPHLARTYYIRWGLSFSPLVLSLFALSLCVRRRARAAMTMTLVCASYIGFYFVTPALEKYLPPVAFGWLPNIAVTLAAIVVMSLPPGARIPGPTESRIPNPKSRST